MSVLKLEQIENIVKGLLTKYHAEYAILFGSYARGEANADSDLDLIVFGGADFLPRNIFALAEELRELTGREADVFESRELNRGSSLFDTVMREGIRIA